MAAFVIDAQLPPDLARRLRLAGHEAVDVNEVGFGSATDDRIARFSSGLTAILVSKDEDFFDMARAGSLDCRFLWVRIGNTSNEALWRRVERSLNDIVEAFDQGQRIVELDRAGDAPM